MKLRNLSIFVLIFISISFIPANPVNSADKFDNEITGEKAQELLDRMTSKERVGQLFLVSFAGATADQSSQIYDLIANYHIGGVVLAASNDNFVAAPGTEQVTYQLIAQLQSAGWEGAQALATSSANNPPTPTATLPATLANYIPLFMGISQGGDGYPDDQILNGLTPLPDLMALGATWNPSLAQKVGFVAGSELSALGFNLFLGPSLDVLETPGSTMGNGLAASIFGGDPFWVGAMGSAYITGLHEGSAGRMLVIADHFPGGGSADRPAGAEPATVRKSLEQMKQIELAPFFSVTGNSTSPEGTSDGLLVSHIRYQGIQGNIRSITRPVSFDSQALAQILSLPPFSTWRAAGGLLVSDDLGSQTVRRFYDPGGLSFLARLVARDAFLAGNDLLYMGNIVSSDAPDNFTSVVRAIDFFDKKYNDDPVFAQSVDDAVLRILKAKFNIYSKFTLDGVLPPIEGLANLGQSQTVTSEVARESVTLVSPDLQDLDSVLPSPPALNDDIVFLTDDRSGRQCSTCVEEPMLPRDALQNAILRLYGPQAGGQVQQNHLLSFSLSRVESILEGGAGDTQLDDSLRMAEWVIINMLDAEPGEPQTLLLRRFISERQDLLRNKRIIVFAFNAPYFLDATDISKLTAFYCLYSKTSSFVDVAALTLFREISPLGSLPVSVDGVGYDLFIATSPDPNQVIGLTLDLSPVSVLPTPSTLEATPTPSFRVGDTVTIKTDVILDHNSHTVPDGTGVRFNIRLSGEGGVIKQLDEVTLEGIADVSFSIDRPGLLEISAESDPAFTSVVLQMDVTNEGSSVTIVTPTPMITQTLPAEILPTPEAENPSVKERAYPGFSGWLGMVILLTGLGTLVFLQGRRMISSMWALRMAMCLVAGGLLAYTYLVARMPGASTLLEARNWIGTLGVVMMGAIGGFGGGIAWWLVVRRSTKQPNLGS
jgi:beta-N-acetylhexosaminidase